MVRALSGLLGIWMLVAGCSPATGRGGSAEVDFLWIKGVREGRSGEGGMSHARVKLEPSRTGMSLGVFETKPGGTSELWRVALWVAALTGTLQINGNPLDFRYSVETETLAGRVDGPSAGGLFAVAVMAILEGDRLSEDATMTGTINPDGTIGPVGGVIQKLAAATKAGKKRFCFPVGQRFEEVGGGPEGAGEQPGSGQTLDVIELARREGVEAVEVEDLVQAYQCLVDRPLPRTKPLRRTEMALSSAEYELLKGKAQDWLVRSQEAYEASRQLSQAEKFEPLWQDASLEYDDATALLNEGLVAAAYWKAVTSYLSSRTVLLAAAMVDRLSTGNPVEALKIFGELEEEGKKKLDKVFEELSRTNADSLNRAVLLLDAYEAAISAVVSREFAKAQYGDLLMRMKGALEEGKDVKELVGLFAEMYKPLSEIAALEVNAGLALDNLALLGEAVGGGGTRLKRIEEVARLFQGAASANVEYFDAIFVREVADKSGKSMEKVATVLMEKEPGYRTAQFNLKLPDSGKMGWAESGLPLSLARLAGALSSFFASSSLVAKFYSIGVKLDSGGNLAGVEREKALVATLTLAEEKARENAALALKHAGAVPESAKVAYQIAMVLRDRTSYQDKLDALEQFWRSSVWSQVAVYLARLEKEGM